MNANSEINVQPNLQPLEQINASSLFLKMLTVLGVVATASFGLLYVAGGDKEMSTDPVSDAGVVQGPVVGVDHDVR